MLITLLTGVISFGQKNYAEIKVDSDSHDGFKVFGDTLNSYQVYMTGENHMYATFNTELQLKFLNYLYETQGVRHFLFEQSPAVGYIINKASIEGKKSSLTYLKDNFYGPFYKMVKKIVEFNEEVDSSEQIKVHGIDVERFPFFSLYALKEMVDTVDKTFEGGEVLEQIMALATSEFEFAGAHAFYGEDTDGFQNFGFGDVSAWGTLSSIIRGCEEYHENISKALGNDGPIFFAIIESLNKGREWYVTERKGDVKSPIVRERYMATEFKRLYEADPTGKFYGQFGRCHIHRDANSKHCYQYYMNSIGNRMEEVVKELEGKVLVIPVYYSNSEDHDLEIINSLDLKDKILTDYETYLVDITYKNGDHTIQGFYGDLPFVIISNEKRDIDANFGFSWNIQLNEFHLGAYYGYSYFPKIRKTLNPEMANIGANNFTNKFVTYTFGYDYFVQNNFGTRGYVSVFPRVSNGDNFSLNGYYASLGSYVPFGNKWITAAIGYDWGYGKMFLKEQADNTNPNLVQSGGNNVVTYSNDMFIFDFNSELRLTLPFISFNFKAGYAFDLSGKYWRLDGKMKDFAKSSWSHPYIQAGASLNFKWEE